MCRIARSCREGAFGSEQFREGVAINGVIARELFLRKKNPGSIPTEVERVCAAGSQARPLANPRTKDRSPLAARPLHARRVFPEIQWMRRASRPASSVAVRCRTAHRGIYFDNSLLLFQVNLSQCGLEALANARRIVQNPIMHKEEMRAVVKHVIVERRHRDAMLVQRSDDDIHFGGDEHEISGTRDFSSSVLKVQSGLQAHRRQDDLILHLVVIGAINRYAKYRAVEFAGPPQRRLQLGDPPGYFLTGRRMGGRSNRRAT